MLIARIRRTRRRSTTWATCSPSAASGSTNRSTTSSGRCRSIPRTGRISTASAGRTSRPASSISRRDNLKRAADQLTTNSVVQDHYGDVLFKLGRYDDAIAAWNTRARRRRRLDRSRRHRQEDQGRKAEASARNDASPRRGGRLRGGRSSASSCGAPLMKLPSGPACPRPTAPTRSTQATAACRGVSHAQRRNRGERLGRAASAFAAACCRRWPRPHPLYIEAPAPFGAPLFILGASTTAMRRCCCRATSASSSTAVRRGARAR